MADDIAKELARLQRQNAAYAHMLAGSCILCLLLAVLVIVGRV